MKVIRNCVYFNDKEESKTFFKLLTQLIQTSLGCILDLKDTIECTCLYYDFDKFVDSLREEDEYKTLNDVLFRDGKDEKGYFIEVNLKYTKQKYAREFLQAAKRIYKYLKLTNKLSKVEYEYKTISLYSPNKDFEIAEKLEIPPVFQYEFYQVLED